MKPVILKGKPAFSDFRINLLLNEIRKNIPDIGSVEAVYVYLLEAKESIPGKIMEKVNSLLGGVVPFDEKDGFFVAPRKGTISPWSSKATDIFRNCGIKEISRVERGMYFRLISSGDASPMKMDNIRPVLGCLHDKMTEGVYAELDDIFQHMKPEKLITVDVAQEGRKALEDANKGMGLAISEEEIDYLYEYYKSAGRNPTDVELVMFGQVNSEHCRHKIFNADWIVDGKTMSKSLFGMIRNTHEKNGKGVLVAYKDNSGILEGFQDEWFMVSGKDGVYTPSSDTVDLVMKVETHNHPTAISPYPGAATGVGGEIRDECATGTGGKTKAGLSAFMVSNLKVPDFLMPWEKDYAEFPTRLATPLEIMIEGPIGGARFGNEFGRPQLTGLFRTYEHRYNGRYRGYHKPIMVAGGMGNIRRAHVHKKKIDPGNLIIQIGGPAMKIGLGGGAASSMATGSNAAELDFDSVQRDNAEMERRCQEVIDACIALGKENPVLSIHDIGAGGLSNGCPELVAETGGKFHLRRIHSEDTSMSPMEIWCCEAQERYVLAIEKKSLEKFMDICARERCPVSVIGEATGDGHLVLEDEMFGDKPIDMEMGIILGKPPKMLRDVKHEEIQHASLDFSDVTLDDAVSRVLRLPAVANKTFLITITDRSVTGKVARDQMTGPYQTPISDCAVTVTGYNSRNGEAMAMGERTPIALISPPASGRMAVGEAITNMAGVNIGELGNIKLSANWMCACGEDGEDAGLFDTVRTVGMEICSDLGICIPVGKDSLSMRTVWQSSDGADEKMTAPLSLIVSSFAPVKDVTKTVTADLKKENSALFLLDLGYGKNRLGGSALAQVYSQVGNECPDLDDPLLFKAFFKAMQELVEKELLLACHDRSDGGLFVAVAEMAFGGRVGVDLNLDEVGKDLVSALFSEELGTVLQVAEKNISAVTDIIGKHGLENILKRIGKPAIERNEHGEEINIAFNGKKIFSRKISSLNRDWSELTYRMQALRDNPECAKEEYDSLLDENDPGAAYKLTYDPSVPSVVSNVRPSMMILREQGINGHVEMAAAFHRVGFRCVDVHMTDLLSGRVDLKDFIGLVACGGFSYGDVLGAGSGWAKSILFNGKLRDAFAEFFARGDTFALGVCNGCQMMSQLRDIIPGAEHWPDFTRNKSEQFEARYVTVEILQSPSVLLKEMAGSRVPIPVAHGEGRADFSVSGSLDGITGNALGSLRYVDNYGKLAVKYPFNPNGSPMGLAGVTTTDGRVTIMMPHPERVFRSLQLSYRPSDMFTGEDGPWMKMFRNAWDFVRL